MTGAATGIGEAIAGVLSAAGAHVLVTDIDDAIINRANREQRPWDDIAQKCERVWFNAMDGINVARPDDIPHATQYVDDMVAMIAEQYPGRDAIPLDVGATLAYGGGGIHCITQQVPALTTA